MKTKTFEIGQRVKVLRGGRVPFSGRVTAIMKEISSEVDRVGRCAGVHVTEDGFYSNHDESPFHPRQLVKLKKVKSVRVTRDKLRGVLLSKLVWTDFDSVCKELGL
jgi:hypothetical protein